MSEKKINSLQPSKEEIQPLLLAFNNRNFEKAIAIGTDLMEIYPNTFFVCNILGSCFANIGQITKSLEYFKKAYQIEPSVPESCSNLAMAFMHLKEFDQAVTYFEKAIENNNDIPEVHFNYGISLANLEKNKLAIRSYKKAIELKPDFIFAYYNLGLLLWKINDLENSLETLKKANSMHPNNPEILASLGAVYKAAGELKDAEINTKKALEIKLDPKYKFNLAAIIRDQGDLDRARSLYEETISLDNNFAEAYNNLGEVLRDLGNSTLARESFEKALTLKSDFGIANYNLGILFQDANELSKASEYFKKSEVFDWRQRVCYCAYKNNNHLVFKEMLENLKKFRHDSPLVASISSHYSQNNGKKDDYFFCPDPISFIKKTKINAIAEEKNEYLDQIIKDIENSEIAERKQGRLINGTQSAGNLFKREEKSLRMLAGLILVEIDNYVSKFKKNSCEFINLFPQKPEFQSSWFVKMTKEGHLTSHIHETGWLSGVLYLKLPTQNKEKNEGSIEFGFQGDNYPNLKPLPTRQFTVEVGDLILFPSSVFHKTLPFFSNEERICVAFDVSPPPID